MKRIYFMFLLAVCMATASFGQSRKQIQQLGILAETWGLLKYYHPCVASGRHDWDSVLIASLRMFLSDPQGTQFSASIDRMLSIAGPDTAALYTPAMDDAAYRQELFSWISRANLLNDAQRRQLDYIVSHPNRSGNHYALPEEGSDSTVKTPNEKPYQEMKMPDVDYRLLGLFRFWNVIQYYYPYKYVIGRPWEEVLTELIPVMIAASDLPSYHRAIARMSASINDSHGGLWPEVYPGIAGKYGPGFNFRLIDGKAVVTKIIAPELLNHPTLEVGSVLTSINGVSLKRLIRRYWDYVPASNPGGKIKTLHAFLLNTFAEHAEYKGTNRKGQPIRVQLPQSERNFLQGYLEFFEMTSPDTSCILPGNIGYVYFSNLNWKNLHQTMNSLMDTRAIIFDMRNYPENGAGTYWVPDYLTDVARPYASTTYPDFSLPGKFKSTNANEGTSVARVGGRRVVAQKQHTYTGKIVLLVDSRTQSAAEWACMTLMSTGKVTVIGSQTAGADGNVTRTVLPGGYKIAFSGLGIYFPDGSQTQRIGIPIDIEVPYTVGDLIHGSDPLLEKAMLFLKE